MYQRPRYVAVHLQLASDCTNGQKQHHDFCCLKFDIWECRLEHTPMTNMKTLERRAESMLLGLLVRSLRRKQTPNPLDSEAATPAHSPSPGVHGSPGEDAAVAEVAPARDAVGRKQIEQQVQDLQSGHGDALMRQQARDELQAELFWQVRQRIRQARTF